MGMWVGSNPSIHASSEDAKNAKARAAALAAHKLNAIEKQNIQRELNSEGLE